jgi:hypothetical protein
LIVLLGQISIEGLVSLDALVKQSQRGFHLADLLVLLFACLLGLVFAYLLGLVFAYLLGLFFVDLLGLVLDMGNLCG